MGNRIQPSPELFLDHAPLPIHFRAWRGGSTYNLCALPVGNTLWSPYRSVTTCISCLERLR